MAREVQCWFGDGVEEHYRGGVGSWFGDGVEEHYRGGCGKLVWGWSGAAPQGGGVGSCVIILPHFISIQLIAQRIRVKSMESTMEMDVSGRQSSAIIALFN